MLNLKLKLTIKQDMHISPDQKKTNRVHLFLMVVMQIKRQFILLRYEGTRSPDNSIDFLNSLLINKLAI